MSQPDRYRMLLGAYVANRLEVVERTDLEAHLAVCADCRADLAQLGPLPDLLRLMPPPEPQVLTDPVGRAARLASMAQRLARRRRRARIAVTAVVLGLAGALTASLVVSGGHAPPVSRARMVAISGPVANGSADLEVRAWGTQIILRARHLPPGVLVAAVVDARPVGSWVVPRNGVAVVELASPLPPSAVTTLTVRRQDTGALVMGSGR